MKKLIFILIIFCHNNLFAQTKSITNDSMNTELINKAGNSMIRFENQSLAGFLITSVGTVLTYISYSKALELSSNPSISKATYDEQIKKNRVFRLAAMVITILGSGLTISSASHIGEAGKRLRKVKKVK